MRVIFVRHDPITLAPDACEKWIKLGDREVESNSIASISIKLNPKQSNMTNLLRTSMLGSSHPLRILHLSNHRQMTPLFVLFFGLALEINVPNSAA